MLNPAVVCLKLYQRKPVSMVAKNCGNVCLGFQVILLIDPAVADSSYVFLNGWDACRLGVEHGWLVMLRRRGMCAM
jgi:hypothetical protein